MAHHYEAYCLRIASDIELPDLVPSAFDGEPDVRILVGSVAPELPGATTRGRRGQTAPNRLLLTVNGVARFLVSGGCKVVVDIDPAASLDQARVFLLGSCLGALLHQRGILVLHATAARVAGAAVLFTGRSGRGKSTLLGAMIGRGHEMMVDDVCGVVLSEAAGPVVLPAFPRIRLTKASAHALDVAYDASRTTHTGKAEHVVVDYFASAAAPLARIYILESSDIPSVVFEDVSGFDAVRAVLTNTYRRGLLTGMGLQESHLARVSAVAAAVPVRRAIRPSGSFEPHLLAEAIEADLRLPR